MIKPAEIITLSIQTFKSHRMRSFLTMLGIIIGVSTVIAILSLIDGLNRSVASQINSLGSNTITVAKFQYGMGRADFEQIQRRKDLTMADAEAIKKLPSVRLVSPTLANNEINWLYYRQNKVNNVEVIGCTPEFFEVNNYSVISGRPLNEDDIQHRRMVCVIGDYIVENLFPNEAPIGKELNVRGRSLKIIGIMAKKGSFFGQSLDNNIDVPITVIRKIFPRPQGFGRVFQSMTIGVLPKDPKKTDQTMDDIRELLRRRRGLTLDKPDDFGLNTQQMLMTLFQNLTRVGFIAIVAIAMISLVVGGIGIMNIMLVSVAERTREIGIRKAVGASNQNILLQFLIESVVLALVGGIIGIAIGILLAFLISAISPLKAGVSLWMIALGFGFSASVGIFFGIYPARKASTLNPIEALRYE
jgi:putative ABC transport system permease protein